MYRLIFIVLFFLPHLSFSQNIEINKNNMVEILPPTIETIKCGKSFQTFNFSGYLNAWLYDKGNSVLTVSDGYIVACTSDSPQLYDKSLPNIGYNDFWIIKFDKQGNKIWEKVFGGTFNDWAVSIVQAPDNSIIIGGYSASDANGNKTENSRGDVDYWIIKMDMNGNKIWDKRFGGNYNDVLSDILVVNNGLLLAGYSNSEISGDKSSNKYGDEDYWIVKIDFDGNKVWDRTYGGSGSDGCLDAELSDNNEVLLVGSAYSSNTGNKISPNYGSSDIWLVKIDQNGTKIWEKNYGGNSFDGGAFIKKMLDGKLIIGGNSTSNIGYDKSENSRGGTDYWIIKIEANGNKIWDRRFGGGDDDYFSDLIINEDSSLIVGGWTYSDFGGEISDSSIGSADIWIVKIDNNGIKLWDKRYGSGCVDVLSKIYRDSDDSILFIGAACYNVLMYKFDECQVITLSEVCENENITIRAKGCENSVNWSNGITGRLVNVTPTSDTNYFAKCVSNSVESSKSNEINVSVIQNALTLSNFASKSNYSAKNIINSNQTIDRTVSYISGNTINLNPGFSTINGQVFSSVIQNTCPN